MNDNQWNDEQEKEGTPEDTENVAEEIPAEEGTPEETYRIDPIPDTEKRKTNKKTGILIAVTAVYALAMGILIGIVLSFLYSGGKTANYNPVLLDDQAIEQTGENMLAAEGIAKARESVVMINVITAKGKGTATGIVLTEDGYILTNHHAVDGALSITVTFLDGVSTSAKVRGSSEDDDLAVIEVEREGLVPADFASTETCFVGQDIYVIGTPVSSDYGWTTTKGIISHVGREIKIYNETTGTLQKKLKLLQTDAMLNPGNSGGPMINAKGQVLGIINMKLAGDADGIGFAIPSDGAVEIANAIMEHGNADSVNSSISSKRPVLGIVGVYVSAEQYYVEVEDNGSTYIRPATRDDIKANNNLIYSEHAGLYVNSVNENTGADGKLKSGDVIVELEGEAVVSRQQFSSVLDDMDVGDTVNIKFYRDGALCSVDIELTAEDK